MQLREIGEDEYNNEDPSVDDKVTAIDKTDYEKLGLKNIKHIMNSLGDSDRRKAHREALNSHFTPHIDELCSDCQRRLENNPLRILDCKTDMHHPAMKTAPETLDFLNETSNAYFE